MESHSSAFYLTEAGPAGAAGWKRFWYDILTGVNASDAHLVLGGEVSMWTDTYCVTNQCGAWSGPTPVGAALFDPGHDSEFARSIGGMIWPRSFVGAASFWNYNETAKPDAASFVSAVNALTAKVSARGGYVCPVGCACDQLSACGKPYLG